MSKQDWSMLCSYPWCGRFKESMVHWSKERCMLCSDGDMQHLKAVTLKGGLEHHSYTVMAGVSTNE